VAFVAPGIEDFLDRFPEFTDEDPDYLQTLVNEALQIVGPTWIEGLRAEAILHYVAHAILVRNVTNPTSGVTGAATSGPIVRETVGPLSVMYKGYSRGGDSAGGAAADTGFDSTPYGKRFLEIRRISFPAVLVI
jgi:hypothetical protein